MSTTELLDQRFTQADVLGVTKLRKELLQTWVNRGVVKLGEQNPGTGKRRLYSALDIVKLGLMRRVADLGLELDIGRDLASEAERLLLKGKEIEWEYYLSMRADAATQRDVNVTVVASAGYSVLALKYGAIVGDAHDMRVSRFTESFDSIFGRRLRTGGDDRPIDPIRRDALARAGVYAEPAVIFPFGEIVNGTLLQVQALREGRSPSVAGALSEVESATVPEDFDAQ